MNNKWSIVMGLVFFVCNVQGQTSTLTAFTLTSPAFKHNDNIPSRYTCDGKNISPELRWIKQPAGTKSFVLIVDDPDAPKKIWVHWIVFNIPSSMTKLPEGVTQGDFITGVTDFYYMQNGVWQYGGPCPPSGQHHYHFKLYALDTMLNLAKDVSKKDLETAMKGHILGEATLIGLYQRKK